MMIGLDMIRVLEDLVVAGVATGDFRADLDPERAVVLVGQQIYGALSVRAGEPDPFRRSRRPTRSVASCPADWGR